MNATIVIPLDGSDHALAALPVAKQLGDLTGATLHLVHVARETPPPEELLARLGVSPAELRGSVVHAERGDAATAILEQARELGAELVVMCTHTAIAPIDVPVGPVALAVLSGTHCPVVFVHRDRRATPWSLRRILLPHDGTLVTSAAIRPAAELAHRSSAELDVLHVASQGKPLPAEAGALTTPRYMDQPQHEWPAFVNEFIERLAAVCPIESLKVRMTVAPGEPADQILRVAREHESDLIVLAWHGEWSPEHAGIVKAVLARADTPTMVIRIENGSTAS